MSRLPREDERIARLLDGREPPRDVPTAQFVAVADRLHHAGTSLDPDTAFRSALRDRLLAQAAEALPRPRTPAGPDAPHAVLARIHRRTVPPAAARRPGAARPPGAGRSDRKLRTRRRVLVSAALVGAALSGSTMLASHDSLPGQPLYGVKLTVENVEVAFARDPAERGRVHLSQARSRAEEVGRVAVVTGRPEEVLRALDAMDRLTRAGFRELATAAVRSGDAQALADLRAWVTSQRELVDTLSRSLPGSAWQRVTQSLSLLQAAWTRAVDLARLPGCTCQAPPQDDLGPLPGSCRTCLPPTGGSGATDPVVTGTAPSGRDPRASAPPPSAPSSATPPASRPPVGSGGPVPPPPAPTGTAPSSSPDFPSPEPAQPSAGGNADPSAAPESPVPSATPSPIDVPGPLGAVAYLIPLLLGG